jgi:heat shock protein 5
MSHSQTRKVGDSAKNQATLNPENTIFNVKRLQADRKLVPYSIVSKANKPMVNVKVEGNEQTYAPEEISAMILSMMKTTAESYLGHEVKEL